MHAGDNNFRKHLQGMYATYVGMFLGVYCQLIYGVYPYIYRIDRIYTVYKPYRKLSPLSPGTRVPNIPNFFNSCIKQAPHKAYSLP
jgi:hypothetical protein